MSKTNPILKSLRESAGVRLAVLFFSFFVLLLFSSGISLFINNIPYGDTRSHLLLTSVCQSVLAFCLPAFILARFCSKSPINWLKLNNTPTLKALLGVLIVYGISMPAMEWIIEWNQGIHFPEALSGIESTFRKWEETNESTTKILLEAHGLLPVLIGVLVIGVLTGFSEELFFRGGLQGIFIRSSIKKSSAIWLAAFIFSVMHFQFFGFVPRLLMGAFFGYLLYWTKSIWVPVFAHMLNNSMVVITSAYSGDASLSLLDRENPSLLLGNSLSVIASVVLTVLFLWLCKNSMFKNNKSYKSIWRKSQLPRVSGK